MSDESIEIEASASSNLYANKDDSSRISKEDNLEIGKISKNSSSNSAFNFIDNEDSAENPNSMGNLVDFLKYKGLSDDLKNRLLINGPTDGIIRLLKALGFSDYDVKILINLWHNKIQDNEYVDEEPIKSDFSSTNGNTCSASFYLKENFNVVLKQALREILTRKPYDPIEFLGYWLLNFTVCEERTRMRKELEAELMAEREKQKESQLVDTVFEFPERDEAEEFNEDWNFVHYEKA